MENNLIMKKALTDYVVNNAANIADVIKVETEDFELILIYSIFRKKEKKLIEGLKNENIEFEKVDLSLKSDNTLWDATVYFDAKKYNDKYGNHSECAATIEDVVKLIVKYFKKKNELNLV